MQGSTRKHLQRIVCCAVIALPIASTADNDNVLVAAAEQPAEDGLSATDRRFLQEVAAGNIEEAHLGRLAAQKAPSESVRVFAQRMAADHAQLNEQLQSIAQAKGFALPTALDAKRLKLVESLQKLDGPAFERAYLKVIADGHQSDIREFRRQIHGSQDSDVKSFAASTLPKLHDHLALVRAATRAAQPTVATPNRSATPAPRRETATGSASETTTR